MIFANKLISLRKKAGWSQEELAEQMDVSRQSVSKWEAAQAVPDLEKMLRLSNLFGVTTDYLLKDEIETIDNSKIPEEKPEQKYVTMEEANAFIEIKKKTAPSIAFGVLLCIISPICLFILGALSENSTAGISENTAIGIGMIILFVFVAIAVTVFILVGSKTSRFEYLEKEKFDTAYGVTGMVNELKAKYKPIYNKANIIGTCFCIMSLIPLFGGIIINENNDLLMACMMGVMFILAGIGVVFFVIVGVYWASFEKLLQEGDYSKEKKERQPITTAIYTTYWLIAVAIYLLLYFSTQNWHDGWIVWPIAGVIFPAVVSISHAILNKKSCS